MVLSLATVPGCAPGSIELGASSQRTPESDSETDTDTDTDADADGDADADTDSDTDADVDTGDPDPVDPDIDGDGYPATVDCDDGDAATFPGADEHCDGADQDCDGKVDEDAVDEPLWYLDEDGDGYGDPRVSDRGCEPEEGFVAEGTDCNDGAAEVNPGAAETCNRIDDDCDGAIDDDPADAPVYYPDGDGDRYGDTSAPLASCAVPAGYVSDGIDCYDGNASVYPGSTVWLTADRGDGSYDADCDGGETQRYTHVSTTGIWGSCCWDPGWVTSAPACGASANWVDASGNQPLVQQTCR
ncbi:MAG: putative metal-binding motif-containing protein [Pseudomonadota bacterium]|nr:putative metal-binding motif-containing protein [Pseudomonadota bacterium]